MKKKVLTYAMYLLPACFTGIYLNACGQEHPEHPAEQPKAEAKQLTPAELSEAVRIYVDKETKQNNGWFLVKDDLHNKTLKLKLDKVHDDRLSPMGNDVYFVCADFKAADGFVYDIDIFMKGKSKDNLAATDTRVHKDNGVARYTWFEENGVWKTKKAGQPVDDDDDGGN